MSPDTSPYEVSDLVDWFFENYEDPVHCLSWNDGEYFWIGGPCYAEDVLVENFGGVVPEDLIKLAVDRIENDGYEWVDKAEYDRLTREDEDKGELL